MFGKISIVGCLKKVFDLLLQFLLFKQKMILWFLFLFFVFVSQVQIVALNEETSEFEAKSTFDHPYPTTKIMWIPDNVSIISLIIRLIDTDSSPMVVGLTTHDF